jgi:hypothetical protein
MTECYLHVFPSLGLLQEAWSVEQEKAVLVNSTDKFYYSNYMIVTVDGREFHLGVVRSIEDAWRFAGHTWSGVRFHEGEFSFSADVVGYLKSLIRQPKGAE